MKSEQRAMVNAEGDAGLSVLHIPSIAQWLERLRIVGSSWVFHLFLSGIIMLFVFLHPPKLFEGDFDTALNYLNTIVSSLSTILALCISIILVAIQLTASNYTHRVLDYFVRLPYNGSLFSFYLVTILRSFFLMSYINDDPMLGPKDTRIPPTLFGLQPVSGYLDVAMSADLVMVAICFISLLVYMYAVVQLLKPERIITLILRDYDRAISRGRWQAALENVEQICDIGKRAASVSDSATGTRCVEVMAHVARRLPLPRDADDPLLYIHHSIVDQWAEMVGVAAKERETGLMKSVIDAMHGQGVVYMTGEAWVAAEVVVTSYRHLVFAHLLQDGQMFYVNRIVGKLFQLALLATDHGPRGQQFCLRTWEVIAYIGECSMVAQPGGLVPLMDDMVLAREVHLTLAALAPAAARTGLVIYFGICKSFLASASRHDVARWSRWWIQLDRAPVLLQQGQVLACALALHANRPALLETMQRIWHVTAQGLDWRLVDAKLAEEAQVLFDGWSWQHLVQMRAQHADA